MPHRLRVPTRAGFFVASLIAAAIAVSGAGAATLASAPTNGCPPSIEGQLVVGKTIAAGNGCWSNNPTGFAYKWLRCNNQTASSCVAISSSRSITLQSSDVGHSFIVLVTASNSAGSTGPVNSKPSDLVSAAAAPQFKTRPTVTGKTEVGQALAAKTGTFSGGIPRKLAFQWQTCDQTGANCTNVSGATSETYGVRSADVGKTIRVEVTASNDYGSDKEVSDRTGQVKAIPQPVAITTTITASRAITTCCQPVRLSGTVSTQEAGQSVVILAREHDDVSAIPVRFVQTDANGDWSVTVRPSVKTTYRAQAGDEPSSGVTVNVRPRVGLGHHGRVWTIKVTGRDTFAGSLVLLQRRAGSRWITVQHVILNLNSAARFKANMHHGKWTLRAYVPSRETGPGYLAGTSHTLRITA
jgi:hypothetical protein